MELFPVTAISHTFNLDGLPLSSNKMYNQTKTGRRFKAKAYADLQAAWALQVVLQAGDIHHPIEATPMTMDIYLHAPREKWWTKKGTIRIIDASNMIKMTEDAVCAALSIDDSWFWRVSVHKVVAEEQQTVVKIANWDGE